MKKSGSKNRSYSQREYSSSKKKDVKKRAYSQTREEEIDERILNIDLKRPKRAFNYYIQTMMKEDTEISMVEATKKYSDKYKKLSKSEKEKYAELANKDKERYEENLKFVAENILKKPADESFTAFKFFHLDFKSEQDKNKSLSQIRTDAREAWDELPKSEKEVYEKKAAENKELYDKFREYRSANFSAYQLFFKEQIKEGSNMKDIAAKWKKTSQKTKDKYEEIVMEEKEKFEKIKDQMELGLNLKPKRYPSAYNFFMKECYEKGLIKGFGKSGELSKKWKSLSEEEKEKYEKLSAKERIIYTIKKRNYDAYVKKDKGKPPSAMNLYYRDHADQGFNLIELFKKWKNETKDVKNKYLKKAEKEAENFKEHLDEFNQRVYDKPPKKRSALYYFKREKYEEVKEKMGGEGNMIDVNRKLGEMFEKLSDAKKEKYLEMSKEDEKNKKAYLMEYKEKGYYTPVDSDRKKPMMRSRTPMKKEKETKSPKKNKRGKP